MAHSFVFHGDDYVFHFCVIFVCLVEIILCNTSCHNDCSCSTGTINNLFHAGYFKNITVPFVQHPYGDLHLLFVQESEDFVEFVSNADSCSSKLLYFPFL